MSFQVPNLNAPLVDLEDGTVNNPWNNFFQQFTQAPAGAISLVINGSPYIYQSKEQGMITIEGGTLTSVEFIRGSFSTNLGNAQRIIPVQIKDIIRVTYSVLPIINFVPDY
jgi:hypothetical protein